MGSDGFNGISESVDQSRICSFAMLTYCMIVHCIYHEVYAFGHDYKISVHDGCQMSRKIMGRQSMQVKNTLFSRGQRFNITSEFQK